MKLKPQANPTRNTIIFILLVSIFNSKAFAQTIEQRKQSAHDVKILKKPTRDVNSFSQNSKPNIVYSDNNSFNVKLSGKLNQTAFHIYDGDTNTLFFGNNNNSDSRFKITGTLKATQDLTVFSKIEIGIRNNSSNAVSQTNQSSSTTPLRIAEAGLESTSFGKLSLGQGPTASDQSAEVDLSGTAVAGYSAIQKMGGGILFRNRTTESLSSISISNAFDNLDGLSRKGRIRYDSLNFAGFNLSASLIESNQHDIALRYANKFSKAEIAGALAYANSSTIDSTVPGHLLDGSISILLSNGINTTLAAGQVNAKSSSRNNPNYYYVKLGYKASLNQFGFTAFSIDYGKFDNYANNNDKAKTYGADIVQNFENWKTQIYAGYRHLTLDQTNVSYHPVNIILTGIMINF